jgi:hypothetical protein
MKCIRIQVQEGKSIGPDSPLKVVRCADDIAQQLVSDNRAEYAPKSEWKEEGRAYYHVG